MRGAKTKRKSPTQGTRANVTCAGWHNGVTSLPHRAQSCRRRIAHVAKHLEPLRTTAKAGFTGELRNPRVRSEERGAQMPS
jgi:hypothetical protein